MTDTTSQQSTIIAIGNFDAASLARSYNNPQSPLIKTGFLRTNHTIDSLAQSLERSKTLAQYQVIIVSLGAEDRWDIYDDEEVDTLVSEIKRVFPSASLYMINGSYGYGPFNDDDIYWQRRISSYLDAFRSRGFKIVGTATKSLDYPTVNFFRTYVDALISEGVLPDDAMGAATPGSSQERATVEATVSSILPGGLDTRGASASTVGKALDEVINKKMEALSEKVLGLQFDVEKYLLSDREVAKKIISKSNPGMSNGQLNFMLYGSETIPKLNVAQVGGGLAGTLDTIPTPKGLTAPGAAIPGIGSSPGQTFIDFSNPESAVKTLSTQGFSGGIIGGSPRAPFESELLRRLRQELLEDEASGLNTVDQKKEIERLEAEAASAPGQDLIDSVGQIKDYVSGGKSVLQARGSGMTKDLAIKSAEFVLRYMNSSNRPVTRSYTFISNRRGLGSSGMPWEAIVVYALDAGTDTGAPPVPTITVPGLGDQEAMEQAALAEDFTEIAKKQAEARLGGYSPYPIDKDSPIIEGAKKKKKEVREAIANFISKQKEMLNDLIASLSIVVSSIPAMGILITTPPFNVPAALTLINLVFQSINKLVGSIVNLIAILEKIKSLSTYFGDKAYRQVARVITPVVEFLTKLIDPIGALKKFIEKIIEQIKKLFNGDNCKKHRRRLNRDLRRKKRDLAKEKDEEEKKDLQDEVDQLNERLKDLEKNCKKTSVEQDTESINQLLKETNEMSTQIVDDITETLVYDVTLPNGEVLTGISEDALQDLKLRYTVLVVDDDGTSGIYRTPSSEPAF